MNRLTRSSLHACAFIAVGVSFGCKAVDGASPGPAPAEPGAGVVAAPPTEDTAVHDDGTPGADSRSFAPDTGVLPAPRSEPAPSTVEPDGQKVPFPAHLPSQSTDASCDSNAASSLHACAYAARNDVVLTGTVLSIVPVTVPFVTVNLQDKALHTTGECGASVDPALIITLEATDVLFGESIEEYTVLDISVGHSDLERWFPRPSIINGSLGWDDQPANEQSPLAPGSILLLGLTRETLTGGWSLMGEPLYSVSSDGAVFGPELGDTCDPVLDSYSVPGGFETFASALHACTSEEIEASQPGRESKLLLADKPLWTLAASCLVREVRDPGVCIHDLDCGDGSICVANECQATE